MRYLIWYKSVYIFFIFVSLAISIVEVGSGAFSLPHHPGMAGMILTFSVYSMFVSFLFLTVHYAILGKIFNKQLGFLWFVAEQALSFGRMLMCFSMTASFDAAFYAGYILLSPVMKSLWKPLFANFQGTNAGMIVSYFLLCMEIFYFYQLTRNRKQLKTNLGSGGRTSIIIFAVAHCFNTYKELFTYKELIRTLQEDQKKLLVLLGLLVLAFLFVFTI